MGNAPLSILVIDDEENLRLVLRALLRQHGYQVIDKASAEEGLVHIKSEHPDFVLVDVKMPGMGGIELCRAVSSSVDVQPTLIVMSAYGSIELAIEAMKAGAYDYISKPFKNDEVLMVLKKAEEREALRRENKALKQTLAQSQAAAATSAYGMVGQSPALKQVIKTIDKVADFKTTVLVLGESGTGKELVAKALHQKSSRKNKPFIGVNCGAIPENLLESELFGHKRGAFTDATSDRRGLFEEAHGGTLLLDEIGELPLPLQVKLLRALQEGSIRKIGDAKDIMVDVRVIAATMRDLKLEVDENRFREDLYYRLNVLPIVVPPLRERKEDIPLLIQHFVSKFNTKLGTKCGGIEPKALKLLLDYPWPGNIRELENTVERAIVLSETPRITPEDLPEKFHQGNDPVGMLVSSGEVSIKKSTRFIEEALIRKALERTRGNRTAAAKILEISQRALLYKLKEYNIS